MELTHSIARLGGGDWSILTSLDSKQNVENSQGILKGGVSLYR
jgi:hypothetical protein